MQHQRAAHDGGAGHGQQHLGLGRIAHGTVCRGVAGGGEKLHLAGAGAGVGGGDSGLQLGQGQRRADAPGAAHAATSGVSLLAATGRKLPAASSASVRNC